MSKPARHVSGSARVGHRARGTRDHEQAGVRYAVVVLSDLLPLVTWLVAPTSTSARAATFRPEVSIDGAPPGCWPNRPPQWIRSASKTRPDVSASGNCARSTRPCVWSSASGEDAARGLVRGQLLCPGLP